MPVRHLCDAGLKVQRELAVVEVAHGVPGAHRLQAVQGKAVPDLGCHGFTCLGRLSARFRLASTGVLNSQLPAELLLHE